MFDDARFASQSKAQLNNPEIEAVVADVVERELAAHFERAPAMLDTILLDLARQSR